MFIVSPALIPSVLLSKVSVKVGVKGPMSLLGLTLARVSSSVKSRGRTSPTGGVTTVISAQLAGSPYSTPHTTALTPSVSLDEVMN